MIIIAPGCGLCNRMRAIASAYNLARDNNTWLLVLWRQNSECNCTFYSLFKEMPFMRVINCKDKHGKYDWPMLLASKLTSRTFLLQSQEHNSCTDFDNEKDEIIRLLERKRSIFIATIYPFYNLDNFNMFAPSEAVADGVMKVLKSERKDSNLIGVHIRRTDNPWSTTNSTTELFDAAIERELTMDPHAKFYLATDSMEEDIHMRQKFGNAILTNPNRSYGRDIVTGMVDAAIDLCCLSRCKKILGSYQSSFTDVAAVWGGL